MKQADFALTAVNIRLSVCCMLACDGAVNLFLYSSRRNEEK